MLHLPALSSVSRHQLRWQFDEESPLPARYFSEAFQGYQLEGRLLPVTPDANALPPLLAIHGARSDYTKLNALLYPLQTMGIASLSVNLSGHNAASGVGLEDTSLGHNLREALRYASRLGPMLHAVLGHSLGGALALKVAQVHRASVKKIVLFCPALYAENAYRHRFGPAFKQVIGLPFGFLDSRSLAFLRTFDGELMLIIGQYDALKSTDFGGIAGQSAGMVSIRDDRSQARTVNSAIPFEVIDILEQSVTPGRLHKLVLPGCDHAISAWLRADPARARGVASAVAAFLGTPAATARQFTS